MTDLNTALSGLTYTRSSTGTDTLEVALVNSDQIYFPTNGHVYQYVNNSLTWNVADTTVQTLTAYGAQGYLVTITSSAENDFVKARLSGDAWIGASDVTTEGDWKWVTGPERGTSFWSGNGSGHTVGGQYASWNSGEPNDSGGNEDCGEEYVANGTWNDLPCTGTTVSGYVAEFGTDSNPATVVSKDVSIVTADVPAVTGFFPATGATNATTSANLVISFSKTVSANTGNILIKRTSDDSTVESIAVTSGQVTGGGTAAITIDPSVTLDEGVQYYVIIPGTAFKDGSNNLFDGISATSTWTFTTADLTAPVISSRSATTTDTGATVTWTTNEAASSKVVYSSGTSYASSTAVGDTSPRVTSHTRTISSLKACTSYNYEAVSADAAGNYATSTSALFTTTGCPGGVAPTSATTTTVATNATATSTATDSGHTLAVTTPANFTATSSSVVIQIKSMPSDTVLDSIGTPSGSLSSAASVVFDVTALVDNVTTLDSFDTPVTITYTYTDADIAGLVESSLQMYHYHGGAWLPLDNCSVNASANTITCTAPSFSTFAIFGSAASTASDAHHGATYTVQQQVKQLVSSGHIAEAQNIQSQFPEVFPPASSSATTVRDLTIGMTGADVTSLQTLLITLGGSIPPGATGISVRIRDRRSQRIRRRTASRLLSAISVLLPADR